MNYNQTTSTQNSPYPKPKKTGGRLLRQMILFLRASGVTLPIDSHILIAVSGGADSMALGHLLCRYGRRIIDPARIRLVHVNHNWRGRESDNDAKFVKESAAKWEIPCIVRKLKSPKTWKKGVSWEGEARKLRKAIYLEESEKLGGACVLTAHQADDLAETLLWRLFTGAAKTHGGGIAVRDGVELRPLLNIRKKDLEAYLKEEGQGWREDSTNHEDRFLRARMRNQLMPAIEQLFPMAVPHLVKLGLNAQCGNTGTNQPENAMIPELVFGISGGMTQKGGGGGVRPRRFHWNFINDIRRELLSTRVRIKKSHLSLGKGWTLSCELGKDREKWIIEHLES